ncbi:site-specific integrase [Vibrio maerlii]|uniref:site-specific integrase n=1 Tax=Vibrio maerlii TaxID=2231648 RepID=UPI000E3D1E75|nr:site-specific integrase [Vibrio maerlii]
MPLRKKISASSIKALRIEDKRLNDTEIAGFHARISSKGAIKYYLYYRINGKQTNYFLGSASDITPAQARDLAKEKVGEVVQGKDVHTERRQIKQTLEAEKHQIFGVFLEEKYLPFLMARNPKTANRTYTHLKNIFHFLVDMPMSEISAWEVQKWISERRKQGTKPATINYSVNTLKGAFSRAVEWGVIEQSDLKSIKTIKEDNTRIRYLSEVEEIELLNAMRQRDTELREKRDSGNAFREQRGYELLPSFEKLSYVDHIEPLVLLAMNTGLRRGELMGLEWPDINLTQKYLTVRATIAKSKKHRIVPLNSTALGVLKKWKAQGERNSYVFFGEDDNPIKDFKKGWNALLSRTNIFDFRFHDLRHHFASKLVMNGVDLNTVRELLGHADLQMTLRYAHLAPEHKASAVNSIG